MTVPAPVPALCTVTWMGEAVELNVALTVDAAFTERVHVAAVPLQAPDQSASLEPDAAAAVSLTDVPLLNFALHVLPHLIPAGLLVTVPVPDPALSIVSSKEVVVARATLAIPHRPRSNPRQQKLPEKDLNLYIAPPEDAQT